MQSYGGAPNGFMDFISEIPLFFLIFGGVLITLVVGGFLYVIIKGITTTVANNAAELIEQKCRVVDKRTEVSGGSGESSASTSYYTTFEFEDHSRIELYVRGTQYGLISVGDVGYLTYQGTRFKNFTRVQEL